MLLKYFPYYFLWEILVIAVFNTLGLQYWKYYSASIFLWAENKVNSIIGTNYINRTIFHQSGICITIWTKSMYFTPMTDNNLVDLKANLSLHYRLEGIWCFFFVLVQCPVLLCWSNPDLDIMMLFLPFRFLALFICLYKYTDSTQSHVCTCMFTVYFVCTYNFPQCFLMYVSYCQSRTSTPLLKNK